MQLTNSNFFCSSIFTSSWQKGYCKTLACPIKTLKKAWKLFWYGFQTVKKGFLAHSPHFINIHSGNRKKEKNKTHAQLSLQDDYYNNKQYCGFNTNVTKVDIQYYIVLILCNLLWLATKSLHTSSWSRCKDKYVYTYNISNRIPISTKINH